MKLKTIFTKQLLFLGLAFFLFTPATITAKAADNIKQITLENGMEIFFLEDNEDALVHIEYAVKAGFSSQTQDNTGFFKLYTYLVKSSNKNINFSSIQCNADSSRYFVDISAPEVEETLMKLSEAMFDPNFSDDILYSELSKMKQTVKNASEDMSVYINSAIDSKVFSEAPWKHDSGIYPSIFKKTTTAEARNIIKDISNNWYTPQNSALFITGNINQEKLISIIENSFGRFYSSNKTPVSKPLKPVNSHRRFVLHAPELSSDLTQVVIQYTTLSMEQADILAASLNDNNSNYKQSLLELERINIPGDEYINVSAAHQKDNSRLIIQTLLQKPENKKIKTNSCQQALEFTDKTIKIPELINQFEFQMGKNILINNMNNISGNPIEVMNNLSAFWAISPYYYSFETDSENYKNSKTTAQMMSRINRIAYTDFSKSLNALKTESPFVFVIINSKDYAANKKEYKDAGFEEITTSNASWYVQEMYKEIKNNHKIEKENQYITAGSINGEAEDNQYYKRHISQIKEYYLSNGIKVITKENKESPNISILLSINGGKIKSSNNNGFEEVMTNIMASVIEKEIYKKQVQGLIISNVNISTKTKNSTSSILIDFQKEDIIQVCEGIKNGIIYGEIPPAVADREVSSRQYRKRLENGSAVNQMYGQAVKEIFGKGSLYNIFEAENEILESTEYLSILAAYPEMLDAGRYNIIVTGNFDDNIIELLEGSIGILANNNIEINKSNDKINLPSNKSAKIKITHTFLTDIPAEEAGPQPAILIPTTEFLDPVMYIIEAPDFGTKDSAIFKAFMKYLEKELQEAVNNNSRLPGCTVTIKLPENVVNFGTIVFQDVKHTKEADSLYKSVIHNILNRLSSVEGKKVIQEIKNNWSREKMKNTGTAGGTAFLIQEGFEQYPENPLPGFYLEEYNYIQNATVKDFIKIMEYFPDIPTYRLYSTTGKK